jgi:hypothetical protein
MLNNDDEEGQPSLPSEAESQPSSQQCDDADKTKPSSESLSKVEEDIEVPLLADGTHNRIKEAKSLGHLMTHYPKNAHCISCSRAKVRKPPSTTPQPENKKTYENFGDHVTADLKTVFQDKKSWGIDGQKCILVRHDSATGWIASYPLLEKTTEQVVNAYLDLQGNQKIKYIYCDGGLELVAACKSLGIRCDTSTPYSAKRNAIAKRCTCKCYSH